MSENLTGEKALRYGKRHTPESRQKMRDNARPAAGPDNESETADA